VAYTSPIITMVFRWAACEQMPRRQHDMTANPTGVETAESRE
jgi:hypothetical protein